MIEKIKQEDEQTPDVIGVLCGAAIGAVVGFVLVNTQRRKRTFSFLKDIRGEGRTIYHEFRRYMGDLSEKKQGEEKNLLPRAN